MMEVPPVRNCEVTDCAYNSGTACHAWAITIGDGTTPKCDTFFHFKNKGGDPETIASIGACKVSGCQFNKKLECQASEVVVGFREHEADCLTFKAT